MTNEEIIHTACQMAGITDPVHTFAWWKDHGFMVRKGEHAIITIPIWKGVQRPIEGEEDMEKTVMFRKMAAFFSITQVDPITDKRKAS